MSRRDKDPYDYSINSGNSINANLRSRRNINAEIKVGALDDISLSSDKKRKNRENSLEHSDYNIDESESEEGPIIAKNAAMFHPPINEKQGKIGNIKYQEPDGPFAISSQNETKNQYDSSPINTRNKYSRDNDDRPSELDQFKTPLGVGMSPIGYSSTEGRRRERDPLARNLRDRLDSDDSDDVQVLDSDDLGRGRQQDRSPHNRNARPRSSWIKKEWNRQSSDLSTPKVVRFKDEFTNPVKPTLLDERLKAEIRKENLDESPRFRARSSYDDDDYVKEISRHELEERISKRKEPNSSEYNMGRRLRSNERLNSSEREYERNQASNEVEFDRPRRI
jgi:hypothetical protein